MPISNDDVVSETAGNKHPIVSDMLLGEAHPFPADMEAMLRRIYAHDPALIDKLDPRYFAGWKAGHDLNAGRALLQAIGAYVTSQQVEPITP